MAILLAACLAPGCDAPREEEPWFGGVRSFRLSFPVPEAGSRSSPRDGY